MLTAPPATGAGLQLAVLGSPINHSQSPALHSAAYAALGLDWKYGRHEVTEASLPTFIAERDAQWRGLSLTMPLKQAVLPLLHERDPLVDLTGGANTVVFAGDRRFGWNTDVFGITASLARAGVTEARSALILGGGATAASALAAAAMLGVQQATVAVRTPARAAWLVERATRQGIRLDIRGLDEIAGVDADLVVSTLPNGATVDLRFGDGLATRATLFDVGYHPWPTAIAALWLDAHGRVVHGLEMLAHQALMQVRIFVTGDPERELPEEPTVFAAMRAAVGLDH